MGMNSFPSASQGKCKKYTKPKIGITSQNLKFTANCVPNTHLNPTWLIPVDWPWAILAVTR